MTEKRRISLEDWGAANFNPPPTLNTLRTWARTGRIAPAPIKAGRAYYVDPDAIPVDPHRRLTLVERMKEEA